ncbi:MAG: nucleotidyltransferase [Verrucomicrobiota bacterium]
MSVADMFSTFVDNLAITNGETVSLRYGELTSALNKKFRDTESKEANSLQVGSFGRGTGIDGISDLDMLYLMPKGEWDTYKDGRQLKLLQDVRAAIEARYPATDVRVDRLVVTVTYSDFHIEVQPVFEQEDGSFKYPDTSGEGSWRITKPREEIEAISEGDKAKNYNLRRLCKMARAWKNQHGLAMGGLLIDTLAYNFLQQTTDYDSRSYHYYDWLCRDFLLFLSQLPSQDYYAALGSGQRVKVKKKFQKRAKKAHRLALEAIAAEGSKGANAKWKRIFGRPFPAAPQRVQELSVANSAAWRNTEEFIEDRYPVDIRYSMKLDCEVKQNGFREHLLRYMLANRLPLLRNKQLTFRIIENTVPGPHEIFWKILNRGEAAQRKNCIRGQIVADGGRHEKVEYTDFRGDHIAECYALQRGVVVAKARLHVPIQENV